MSSSSAEKIKERLSIVDVISSYIQVDQSGKNFKAKCPFHNEKTPSFFISLDRGTYYCFGCGEKGDIFSFVEKFEGLDFFGSLKLLAERAGVTLETRNKDDKEKDKKELYYEILEEATKFFVANFDKEPNARAYLINRGIIDTTIKNFRVGYVKDEWRSLGDYLMAKGYKREDLEIVGLVKKTEQGHYDRFRGRIMFPISDSSGRVIAFSGRIFGRDDSTEARPDEAVGQAKYLNSPDTPLFNKSNVLFGIDKAKLAIRKMGYSIVVEGQMDLVLSHQAGFSNTVAVSGTAFTDNIVDNESKINNFGLIRRLTPNIIFAYDGDSAGIRAASRSAMIALSLDMQVKVAGLPEGKDPADIIRENPEQWKDIIKNSTDIITFHVDRICKNTNDIRQRGKQVRDIIFPFLVIIKSSIDKSSYISIIHSKTGIPSNAIIEDFSVYERNHQVNNIVVPKNNNLEKIDSVPVRNSIEESLFGIIFLQENKDIGLKLDSILNSLKEIMGEDEFKIIYDDNLKYKEELASKAEDSIDKGKISNVLIEVTELMLSLEKDILNKRKILLQDKIRQKNTGEADSDPGPNLLTEIQKVNKRLEEITNNRLK